MLGGNTSNKFNFVDFEHKSFCDWIEMQTMENLAKISSYKKARKFLFKQSTAFKTVVGCRLYQ